MTKLPLSAIVIGILFLTVGVIGVVHQAIQLNIRGAFPYDGVLALLVDSLAVVGGAFLLRGANWARWLLAIWMAFHVVVSAFHPLRELIVHVVLFSVLAYFLFCRSASIYFRRTAPRGDRMRF